MSHVVDDDAGNAAQLAYGALTASAAGRARTTEWSALETAVLAAVRPVRYWLGSGWLGHTPFMFAVVGLHRPRRFVELGVQEGRSFFAACQAVQEADIDCECVAVDRWTDDPQAGSSGDVVLGEVIDHLDHDYSGFASYVRAGYDEAAGQFEDGSIDLLHLHGAQSRDAVRHDFETWRPKLSRRGVVLFHGVNDHQPDAGVWRFWREIEQTYLGRTLFFGQAQGLGLLSLDEDRESPVNQFITECVEGRLDFVQQYFTSLAALTEVYEERSRGAEEARRAVERVEVERAEVERRLAEAQRRLAGLAANGAHDAVPADVRLRHALHEVDAFRREARTASTAQAAAEQRLNFAGNLVQTAQAREREARTAFEVLRNSRVQKLARGYYSVVEKVAPTGTRRRRGYGATLRGLVRVVKPPAPAPEMPKLPPAANPAVSIVVPVHGKWEYTEGCLRSLAALRTALPFEVLVVDDASPDDSRRRLESVEGIRVVPLDVNRGYVGACNAGIEASRADLVVLLNNDTHVADDWLDPLVAVMDDPTVGLVGSRLVYPDGRLQEAGGIIFSDGTGWNFGRFDDPEAPAYTYRRDVDYVSGASIMVRRTVLEELGGLDTALTPAYYDDTDLAFGVRKLGLRVVYEPTSVVVHLEGGTHGTDENVGLKAYQVVNKAKFVAKWADELQDRMPPGPANVQRAARRRNGHGIVVVIDHYLPRPDEDSGSVRMLGLLKALRALGYGVIFVPDDRMRYEPYCRRLQELGIEVLYGGSSLPALLGSLADDIVAVFASRVTVAHRYLIDVRTVLPHVPFIFDTVDLHHLREEREAQLAGITAPPRAQAVREFELALVRAAETTLVVSSFEKSVLGREAPGAHVAVLPNVHAVVESQAPIDQREGLLFVGSFAHTPNVDALRWFTADVLPLITDRHPGIPVHVVGRSPSPELVATAPSNVTYHGWVPDLAPLYAQARIVVAPLRYGAGVKGKIGEAMSHGVPVVMTPVGAEGMDIVDGETALIATDAAEFADAVDKLLVDDDLWAKLATQARTHIEEVFGVEPFVQALRDAIAEASAVRAARVE